MVRFYRFTCKTELRYNKKWGNLNVTVREKSKSSGGDEAWWSWEKAQVSHTEFQMLAGDDRRLEKW